MFIKALWLRLWARVRACCSSDETTSSGIKPISSGNEALDLGLAVSLRHGSGSIAALYQAEGLWDTTPLVFPEVAAYIRSGQECAVWNLTRGSQAELAALLRHLRLDVTFDVRNEGYPRLVLVKPVVPKPVRSAEEIERHLEELIGSVSDPYLRSLLEVTMLTGSPESSSRSSQPRRVDRLGWVPSGFPTFDWMPGGGLHRRGVVLITSRLQHDPQDIVDQTLALAQASGMRHVTLTRGRHGCDPRHAAEGAGDRVVVGGSVPSARLLDLARRVVRSRDRDIVVVDLGCVLASSRGSWGAVSALARTAEACGVLCIVIAKGVTSGRGELLDVLRQYAVRHFVIERDGGLARVCVATGSRRGQSAELPIDDSGRLDRSRALVDYAAELRLLSEEEGCVVMRPSRRALTILGDRSGAARMVRDHEPLRRHLEREVSDALSTRVTPLTVMRARLRHRAAQPEST